MAAQDIVYLGGGSTPVLVAAMRVLGLDRVLRSGLASFLVRRGASRTEPPLF